MAVNVLIKPKGLLKKSITIEELIALKNLGYGISDENCVLEINKVGKYLVLYDPKLIGRGIEVTKENDNLLLRLALPTTLSEIKLFYDLIKTICQKLGLKEFLRDEEVMPLNYIDGCIEADRLASIKALSDIEQKILNNDTHNFAIFGAMNPIFLGQWEIKEINADLKKLEYLLNRLQQMDAYYANPHLYKRSDGSIFGVYFVGKDILTIVPEKPFLLFSPTHHVQDWYVMLQDNITIKYDDFIKNVKRENEYDDNHFVVLLNKKMIDTLKEKYAVDNVKKVKSFME